MDFLTAWDYLVESGVSSEDELELITAEEGSRLLVLEELHFHRTGCPLPAL